MKKLYAIKKPNGVLWNDGHHYPRVFNSKKEAEAYGSTIDEIVIVKLKKYPTDNDIEMFADIEQ